MAQVSALTDSVARLQSPRSPWPSSPADGSFAPAALGLCINRPDSVGTSTQSSVPTAARWVQDGGPQTYLPGPCAPLVIQLTTMAQNDILIAMCALEATGFRLVTSHTNDPVGSWLRHTSGYGHPLQRIGGLYYLRGDASAPGCFLVSPSGPIKLCVDTGAQVSLGGPCHRPLLCDIRPGLTVTAAGGTLLPSLGCGNLRVVFPPQSDTLVLLPEPSSPDVGVSVALVVHKLVRRSSYPLIEGAGTIHARFGITDVAVMDAFIAAVDGVVPLSGPARARAASLDWAKATTSRRPIHHVAVDRPLRPAPRAGEFASMDFTRMFEPDVDGYIGALVFLDVCSDLLWETPVKSHDGTAVIAAVELYREFVRSSRPEIELLEIRSDCDPAWTVNMRGPTHLTSAMFDYLSQSSRSLKMSHSPPRTQALNPVEGSVRMTYYLMNYFLHLGMLTTAAWHDMFMGSIYVRNRVPRLRASSPDRLTPFELFTGQRPDVSCHIAHPGQLVAIHLDGAKANAGATKAHLGYYVCPSPNASWLVRSFKTLRLGESAHVRPCAPLSDADGVVGGDFSPRAVAARHALSSTFFRGGFGLLAADAPAALANARRLLNDSPPSTLDSTVVWLDPISGLPGATRTFVPAVLHDSGSDSLALVESDLTSPGLLSPPHPSSPPVHDLADAVHDVGSPPDDMRSFRAWVDSLPPDTALSFTPGGKALGSASGLRYDSYSRATTIRGYLDMQPDAAFAYRDLKYDLAHGKCRMALPAWHALASTVSSPLGVIAAALVRLDTLAPSDPTPLDVDSFSSKLAHSVAALDDGIPTAVSAINAVPNSSSVSALHQAADAPPSTALLDSDLAFAAYVESLEDGSSLPHTVGGSLADSLTREGLASLRVHALSSPDAVGTGPSKSYQTVKAMRSSPNWLGEGGLRQRTMEELDHVINVKKALVFVDNATFHAAVASYGRERVEIKNLLTPGTTKLTASGEVNRTKVRVVLADIAGVAQVPDTFSAAVSDDSIRFMVSALSGRPCAMHFVLDVRGAYFEGRVLTPEEGGRVLFAPVPDGWEEFGYPSRDVNGRLNFFRVDGNIPGRQDAGAIWEREYDAWLLDQGFAQSIVDRRVFFKYIDNDLGDPGLFVLGIYVDDNFVHVENKAEWKSFYAAWSTRFPESSNTLVASNDFLGVSYDYRPDGTVVCSCGKLLAHLRFLLSDHVIDIPSFDTPLPADVLPRLREGPSVDNPLMDKSYVSAARRMTGVALYATRVLRADVNFAIVALSAVIVTNLTKHNWHALLRVICFLVFSSDVCLVFPPSPLGDACDFLCSCDSSCINAPTVSEDDDAADASGPLGGSYGGYALFHPGKGAFF